MHFMNFQKFKFRLGVINILIDLLRKFMTFLLSLFNVAWNFYKIQRFNAGMLLYIRTRKYRVEFFEFQEPKYFSSSQQEHT